MLRVAIHNLVTFKGRSAATAVAVALGAAFLAGTLVLADTTRAALDSTSAQMYSNIDVYVRGRPNFGSGGNGAPRIDAALVERAASAEGVAVAEARIEGYAQAFDRSGTPIGSPEDAVGGNWSGLEDNPFRLVAGDRPRADDEVVIDRGTAEKAGFAVGDVVKIATNSGPITMMISGISAFGSVDSTGDSSFVHFTRGTAERLLAPFGRIDGVAVVAEPGVSAEAVRDRLDALVGEGPEILTAIELATENGAISAGVTNAIRTMLLASAGVALFVGGFIVNNTFSILVAQRTREVGLQRALGATRRQVLRSVLVEASVVGVVGATAGAVAGVGAAAGLRRLMMGFGFDIPAASLVVAPISLLAPIIIGSLLAVASAILPARAAAAVSPIAALRDAAVDPSHRSRARLAAGTALVIGGGALVLGPVVTGQEEPLVIGLGAAVVFLGLAALGPVLAPPFVRFVGSRARTVGGMPAELARQNAARNARRTSGAAASLMIGIGLVTLITVFASSAKATIARPYDGASASRPDFVIERASPDMMGFSPALAERIAELPEIESVAVSRTATAEVAGDPGLHVQGVDSGSWLAMAGDATVEGASTQLRDNEVSVLKMAAVMKGWSIGSVITLHTGDREQPLRIVGTRSSGPPFLVSLSTYESLFVEQLDTAILVKKHGSVSTDTAENAVRALLEDYPTATMLDARGKSNAQAASIDQFANSIYVLLALALFIALIGISTTLALSVVEQTRDIGLLRAVGATAKQTGQMVRWESLLIVLFGSSVGLTAGVIFGWAILQALPDDAAFRVPIGQILVIIALAATAAVVAAAGPARRASRLRLLTALVKP